jgi:hypothetical protein
MGQREQFTALNLPVEEAKPVQSRGVIDMYTFTYCVLTLKLPEFDIFVGTATDQSLLIRMDV